MWFIFNLREKNKKREACAHIITYLCYYSLAFGLIKEYITEVLACSWYWCELVHLNLNVYNRLATLPSSVDWTVHRRLHTLSTVIVWLDCPDLGAWLEVLCSQLCIYAVANITSSTYIVTSVITSTIRQQCNIQYISSITLFWFHSICESLCQIWSSNEK